MKNLPNIIKGDIPLTINFALEHGGLMITPIEAEKFHIMLESVFNAGKNGIVSPELEADAVECYSYFINKVNRPKFIVDYIKARNRESKEKILEGVKRHRPEWIKMRNENRRLGHPLGKGIVHPRTFINEDRWNDGVEGYTPTAREEVKTKPILTVDVIMGSKQGQYALEKGVAGVLLSFVQSNKKYPTEDEFRGLYNIAKVKAEQPLKDEIDIKCDQVTRQREQNLKNSYWKG